jgi:hypothetical protein
MRRSGLRKISSIDTFQGQRPEGKSVRFYRCQQSIVFSSLFRSGAMIEVPHSILPGIVKCQLRIGLEFRAKGIRLVLHRIYQHFQNDGYARRIVAINRIPYPKSGWYVNPSIPTVSAQWLGTKFHCSIVQSIFIQIAFAASSSKLRLRWRER